MIAPQKEKCSEVTEHCADQTADALIVGQHSNTDKIAAKLKAQYALAGHEVHELADGGFLVTKWGHSRYCPDLHALAGFARQTGVTR